MSRAILMLVALVAAGAATQVEAGHRHNHYGHNHGGYRYGSGFRSQNFGYYGSPWRGNYHNTGHYDYHPTTVVPHRNHYHVVPGHYHWHNTGHWHH